MYQKFLRFLELNPRKIKKEKKINGGSILLKLRNDPCVFYLRLKCIVSF